MKKMKKIETNTSKKPMKRLIALWVVFVMLIVPFANHVGKNDVKAEGGETAVSISKLAQNKIDVKTDEDGNVSDEQDVKSESFTLFKGKQCFTGLDFSCDYDDEKYNMYYWIGTTEPQKTLEPAESGVLYKMKFANHAYTCDIAPESYITSDTNIGIYVAKKDADQNIQSYILCNIVAIHFVDTVFDKSYKCIDGNYVNQSVTLSSALQNNIVNSTIRYYIKENSEATDSEKSDVSNYDITSKYSDPYRIDVSAYRTKTVYVYAACIISDSDGDKLLEYTDCGHAYFTEDAVPPTIECTAVSEKIDANYSLINKTNYFAPDSATPQTGTYYGESDSYQYTFSIVDKGTTEDDITGVKADSIAVELLNKSNNSVAKTLTTSDYSFEPTTGTLTVTLKADDAKDYIVKVSAYDNIGNPGSGQSDIRIMQAKTGTTVDSVKIDGEDLSTGVIYPKLEAKKTITVVLKSDKNIDNISLQKTGSQSLTGLIAPEGSKRGVDRVYTITATFIIPEDLTKSTTYEGYSIVAKAGTEDVTISNNNTLGKIIYDAQAPTFDAYEIQKNTDGTNWTNIDPPGSNSAANYKETYVKELNTKYRYAVKASDLGGSEPTNLKVYNQADPFETSWTKDGDYFVSSELQKPGASDSDITDVTVVAKDEAGNTTSYPLRTIRELDESFKVNVTMLDASGNLVPAETLLAKKFTNQKYTLNVTAESAYSISEIGLFANDATYEKKVVEGSFVSVDLNPTTHRRSATATFEIPEGTANTLLSKMYVVAKNSDVDASKNTVRYPEDTNKYLGDVLYDQTAPMLDNIVMNEWRNSYTAAYHIKSGAESVESDLVSAEYTITGSKADVTETITVPEGQKEISGNIDIPESTTPNGTALSFKAKDQCENELPANVTYIKIDKTRPAISFDVNGKTIHSAPIEGEVTIKANVSDNLTIGTATLRVQGPNTDKTVSLSDAIEQTNVEKNNTFTLNNILGKTAEDGTYTATVNVADKAGNSASQTITFKVDNTIPVVTAKISDGVTAGKQPGKNFDGTDCDYFYRSNVTALLTYEDDNLAQSKVVVKDNGTTVPVQWSRVGTTNKYQATYVAAKEGAHTITIGATDEAGNAAVTKQIVFIKDTAAPAITAVINGGMVYNENMGVVDLTANANVSFSVSDSNEDVKDFNYQLIKTEPDQLPVTADVIQTETRGFGYVDEADYIVKVYAIDKAGNKSAERTVQFRVDKTAPELKISGASSGATLNSGTTLTFSMTEAFWKDASGTVTITRKPKDGAQESTYKTIDFKPTARTTTMTETLSETGEYKVTFTGKDRAGHSAEAASYTVKIDTGKPVIALSGVKNNDKTTDAVEFTAQIDEDFYLTKSVSIKATRTYLDKTSYQEKTEDLQITGYNPAAATTLIRNTFTEDGIYKIQIDCKDAAGNTDTQEVSFTIDKTKPVIDAKVLAAYAGKLTAFSWDYDLDDIIYDLTVCDVHMYLNGTEYDGTSEVEDGAYELKIVAEDELGNQTEETSNFSLDTKAPTFIVTGVEDGEVKDEQYDINVSLQLEEDTLDSVSLNGKAIEIKDDAASITVTEKGDYKLTMKAHDEAGNEAEKTISFTYGEKKSVVLYVVIGVAALAVLGGGGAALVIGLRKKKA